MTRQTIVKKQFSKTLLQLVFGKVRVFHTFSFRVFVSWVYLFILFIYFLFVKFAEILRSGNSLQTKCNT